MMVEKLICEQCGTSFNCGSTEERSCWCMSLPNMAGRFDLAGRCLCPDCLTLGQAKKITKQRKERRSKREQQKQILRF